MTDWRKEAKKISEEVSISYDTVASVSLEDLIQEAVLEALLHAHQSGIVKTLDLVEIHISKEARQIIEQKANQ